ncbi:MAG: NADH-quinone oxidoreductase subunit NuoE family protein [Candidatus Thorarchaeota archaeon]|jgi:NADH-quinone oxidoreductase subunit E
MSDASRKELVSELIPYLQTIQQRLGYIPKKAVTWLADELRLSEQDVYGVATFYKNFRFFPPGKHEVKMCMGTACYVQGGERLLTATIGRLGIEPGETTEDQKFSLERVACLGCCALAPVVVADEEVHGKMTQRSLSRLLNKLEKEEESASGNGGSK